MLVPCVHHDAAFCPGSRLGRQPAPHSKPLPIMCWDHRPRHRQHSKRALEEKTKTPYSLDINLITTRRRIAANRRLVNKFFYTTSRIGRTTSRCAAPRHARHLSSTFSKIWSIFNQDHHRFVVKCCIQFPQLLVRERNKKLKLGMKMGKELKRIPNKYAHICSGFFLTPSPTSPSYANFTSAKNDLQY